jgi:predicted kinase
MEAVIFAGIQGSGKSTFFKQRFFDSHVRINLDMLQTRNRERIIFEACLIAKQKFVLDKTNLTRKERENYIVKAKKLRLQINRILFSNESEKSN